MSTLPSLHPNLTGRHLHWRPIMMIVGALLIAFSMIGILVPAAAQAANVSIAQCNNRLSGAAGAENTINCTVTVDNYVVNNVTSSRTTVSLVCTLNPCSGTPVSSTSPNVVTNVSQCNGSATLSAAVVICRVVIRNHISPASTPTPATLNQCVGSSGAGTADLCTISSVGGAPVTQCNGSVTGGGGGITCSMDTNSTVSAALPVIVNQCNGTATGGGSFLTCTVGLTNDNDVVGAPSGTPTTAPTTAPPTSTPPSVVPTTVPATTGPGGTGGVPTAPGTLATPVPTTPVGIPTSPGTLVGAATPTPTSQVLLVPTGGVQTGGGSTSGLQHVGLLALGGILLLAAGLSAGLRRRFTRSS